jgi:transketolase
MQFEHQIHAKAIELARHVVRMTSAAGSGHPSSGLSLAHLVAVLMYDQMRYDPRDPWNRAADRLVVSEGHAVPIVYAAYADLGGAYGSSREQKRFLTTDDLSGLREIDSILDGHPNPALGFPFFDSATGSLGQGLSTACGLGLAARLDGIDKKIYTLIGDGESREGQVWEACDFCIDTQCYQVVPIFNCNGLGQSDAVSPQQSAKRLDAKLRAFGFETMTIDGHQPREIKKALEEAAGAETPHAIIAKTVKGWGVAQFQQSNYHGKTLKADEVDAAMRDLDEQARRAGLDPARRIALSPPSPSRYTAPVSSPVQRPGDPDFKALLEGDPYMKKLESGLMSTRRAYGLALREMIATDERIVALDGDVKNSTFAQDAAKRIPERFFECRIAEQNMISAAAGLAAGGKKPFLSSFAKFLVRGYDQLELALIAGAPIKLCGSHAGASIGADGPSQMGLTDVAYMRSLASVTASDGSPLLIMFIPSCGVAAYKCMQIMADYPGACYIRTIRADLPLLYNPDESFEIGGVKELRGGDDVALMASGYMVHVCLEAARQLEERGISALVADCYGYPVNHDRVTGVFGKVAHGVITVEDTYGNGLGASVASIAGASGVRPAVKQLHVARMPKSGRKPADVLAYVNLSTSDVVAAAREAVSR